MNSRQRVLRLLRGEPADRVARGEVSFDEQFVRDLMGFRRRRAVIGRVEQNATIAALNLDLITLDVTNGSRGLANEVDKDRLKGLPAWRGSGLAVIVKVDGPLNRILHAQGVEETRVWLEGRRADVFSPPALAATMTRHAVDRIAAAGADAVLISDDRPELADIVPPERLRPVYLPLIGGSIRAARAHRLPVLLHFSAWMRPALGEIAALEPNGLQGLADLDLNEVRSGVGPDVCLWGNVGTAWLAQSHSPEEAAVEAERILAAGPRLIVGSAAGLKADANVQTVINFYEAVASVTMSAGR